ncbi:hypothetical protein LC76P1_00203 [Lysinibacillus phage LC76P1]|nr:hypothetical protein LC76P1_00203 [Lysinibacillus phage LC76P1]
MKTMLEQVEYIQNMEITPKGLKKVCQDIARIYFGREFNLPVKFINDEKVNMWACYTYYSSKKNGKIVYKAHSITVNFKREYSREELIGMLKHEVCHWACQMSGKAFRDGSKNFESELYRIGAPSTHVGNDMDKSKEIQEAIINGELSVLGRAGFEYDRIWDGLRPRFKLAYRVKYQGVYIGEVHKCKYGKYIWIPVISEKDLTSTLAWNTRKGAVEELLKRYEKGNGKIDK